MQIEIKLDESCKEPKIIIHTDKMTEEVSQIVKLLSEEKPEVFAAIHENGEIVLLEQTEIIRIYAENERVYAKTKDGSYRLKARLYELEERLNKKMFIRISNSEIINLKEVKKFDLSFSGTICVSMSDKTATYVSRRYVRKIIGLAISTAITIFSSLIYGDGNYYPVVPALVEQCGNEINAVVAQMIASLLYGAVWAGASVIWEMDDWSLLRQTVTHLLAGSIATFPVAYLMYWMKHSIAGVVVYFAIFIGIYVGIWITLYSRAKREVTKLNEKVSLQNR